PKDRCTPGLKTVVPILLGSRYPMFVWWGQEFIQLYNDAYAPMLGTRHPHALGQPAPVVWADVWDVVGPQAEAVLYAGQSSWNEELLLIMERYGYLEETYFTFSYSPVADERGGVGGVFCAVTEDTGRVLGQRRLRTLQALAAAAVEAKTVEDTCALAARVLAENRADVPFALLYLLDSAGELAQLVSTVGLEVGAPGTPLWIDLSVDASSGWPLRRVMESGASTLVEDLADRVGPMPGRPWPDSPH